MRKKLFATLAAFLILFSTIPMNSVFAVEGVSLFTPFTGTSALPGETITYNIDVINDSSSIQRMSFSVDGLPEGWDYSVTANGRELHELSVRGESEQEITLDVTIPFEVNTGDYRFNIVANDGSSTTQLPLLITVTEQGTSTSELTTDQANLQGHSDSKFNYTVTLRNRTADSQNYALSAEVDQGWQVVFKSGGDSVTSVELEPNSTQDINVEVTPPENVEAGTYQLPIKAQTSNTSADLTLEAVITGSYDIEISTPDGNLSRDVTAGGSRTIDLVVTNTGTAPLAEVDIRASTPPNWDSEFDTSTIGQLEPGASKTIKATITAPSEAIAGDYVVTFEASAPEVSSEATFRISVETSTLWGIVAIVIIGIVVGGLYYIFRKYGRR